MKKAIKNWGQEIVDLINKKSVEIEDPRKRFQYFRLLARAEEHEAAHAAEELEGDLFVWYDNMVDELCDKLREFDLEKGAQHKLEQMLYDFYATLEEEIDG